MKKAIVLLSGGLDSITVLQIVKNDNHYGEIHALSFFYNQRHAIELEKVKEIAKKYNLTRQIVINLDISQFGGSSLVDSKIAVPKNIDAANISSADIPNTYVPGRNTVFISHAFAYAESLGGADIYIGANAIDYSNYPDCRPEYIEQFNKLLSVATKYQDEEERKNCIRIYAPLMYMSKADIIKKGIELGVDYSMTTSCYDPSLNGKACGLCDACVLRLKGFSENNIKDPINYK